MSNIAKFTSTKNIIQYIPSYFVRKTRGYSDNDFRKKEKEKSYMYTCAQCHVSGSQDYIGLGLFL